MPMIRYQPVTLFDRINDEIKRQHGISRAREPDKPKHAWAPAVDIREEAGRYLLTADIPGVDRDNIEITLEDGVLTLKGKRNADAHAAGQEYRHRERVHGDFMRQFSLPDSIDAENISASVKDGVLDIVIPKQALAQPTRITIN